VARNAKRPSIANVKSQFWVIGEPFDVICVQFPALLPARLAGVVISLKYGAAPLGVSSRRSQAECFSGAPLVSRRGCTSRRACFSALGGFERPQSESHAALLAIGGQPVLLVCGGAT
jgi:hypothetical protein